MYKIASQEPFWEELIPADDENPAVRVLFAPIGRRAVRAARQAVAVALGLDPNDVGEAGDAFSGELIRAGIRGWEGIGDDLGNPIEPTPDLPLIENGEPVLGDDDRPVMVKGTISQFLGDNRLFATADAIYVVPWVKGEQDRKKSLPSPSGISAGATQASDIANSPAPRAPKAGAKPARTSSRSRKAKKPS